MPEKQWMDVLPIPNTKRVKYVEQNIAAANIVLNDDELNRLEAIVPLELQPVPGMMKRTCR